MYYVLDHANVMSFESSKDAEEFATTHDVIVEGDQVFQEVVEEEDEESTIDIVGADDLDYVGEGDCLYLE